MSDARVFSRHTAAAGFCTPGVKAWFAARGLSWRDFFARGVDAQTLLNSQCPHARRASLIAIDEAQSDGD